MEADNPLEFILQEVERALTSKLYYLAIVMAVSLPDVCAALQSKNGETSGEKYKAWYTANLATALPNLTDVDCYSLRCGVLHQGRFGHKKMQYGRVLFLPPTAGDNLFVGCIANDAYFFTVEEFVHAIAGAVRAWLAEHANDPNVKTNLPRLVRTHPTGLAPYIVGTPVIR